jgi:hypothetical protein
VRSLRELADEKKMFENMHDLTPSLPMVVTDTF